LLRPHKRALRRRETGSHRRIKSEDRLLPGHPRATDFGALLISFDAFLRRWRDQIIAPMAARLFSPWLLSRKTPKSDLE